MPESQESYLLEILFNKKQISLDELEQKIKNLLQQCLPNPKNDEIKIINLSEKALKLSIRAELDCIDSCHEVINKFVIKYELTCVRIIDEAGDEIRHQAYKTLSQIEQRFRAFISRAFIEVDDSSFEWGDIFASSIPQNRQQKIESILVESKEESVPLHFLECTNFEDLLAIIEFKASKTSKKSSVSIEDLIELFSAHKTITKVRAELEKRITEISYWDRIFSRYFQNKKQWEDIKKILEFVIKQRNKVMHHRPIRLGTKDILSKKRKEIFSLLDTAKFELTKEERIETQKDIEELQDLLDNEEMQELLDNEEKKENLSGVILNFTDTFQENLKSLSKTEQSIVTKKLKQLNQVNNNRFLIYSKYFFKKLPQAEEENAYSFKVNYRIRIICTLNIPNNEKQIIVNLINVGYRDKILHELERL